MGLNRSVFAPGWVITGRAPTRSKVELTVWTEAHIILVEKSMYTTAQRSTSKRGSPNCSAKARASVLLNN